MSRLLRSVVLFHDERRVSHSRSSDYDLCTTCIVSGGAERHNPFHEFFEVTTPGRVVVYDREPSAEQGGNVAISSESVLHHAICNLCDSQIRGDRYVSFAFDFLRGNLIDFVGLWTEMFSLS